jgi:hypothetical protein
MDILTKTELKKLMHKEQTWCISIFLPTHRTGRASQQDVIRLKNLLGEAEKHLADRGVGRREIQNMLEPANNLVQDSDFWQHQSEGLVIFISDKMLRYRLPLNFEALVVVGNTFYIQPLLPLFTGDGQFYILALSQSEVRLLNGTQYSVSEVEIGHMIDSMAETISSDDHQASLQLHSTRAPTSATGGSSVTFHGQGGGSEGAKTDLLNYFRQVANGLTEFLQGDQAPLVLAGVNYLLPIYKEANIYPFLIDTVIEGNPDLLSMEDLHKSAWDILRPQFQLSQADAVAQYHQFAGQKSERIADTFEKALLAAYDGRVETLFLPLGVQKWGVFEPGTQKLVIHDPGELGDEPLLDFTAVQTYLKGGVVYVMAPEDIPGGGDTAAVLRY